jgi:hypothetical protein
MVEVRIRLISVFNMTPQLCAIQLCPVQPEYQVRAHNVINDIEVASMHTVHESQNQVFAFVAAERES